MKSIIDFFKSYGVEANYSVTFIVTIFVFFLGEIFKWAGRKIKEFKDKHSYKKSLLLILKDFSKACEKQQRPVTASLEKAGFRTGNDFIINYVPIGTLGYLNTLDFNIFLKNFEPFFYKKNYSKAISKLFELIAQIKVQNDQITGFTKMMSEAYQKHEKQFNESVNGLRRLHDELGVRFNGAPLQEPDGPIIQGIFKIFGKWQQNGEKTDINSVHTDIVCKILELNRKHQNSHLILPANELCLNADIAYINIEKIEGMLFKKFNDFAHFHKRAAKLTNVIIKILK
jgi:hypothetical protein